MNKKYRKALYVALLCLYAFIFPHAFSSTTATSEVPLIGLQIKAESNRLKINQHLQIETIFKPYNTTEREVFFSSTNKKVLTVSHLGVVHGVANGRASVLVSVPGKKKRLRLDFSVGFPVEKLSIDIKNKTLGTGTNVQLKPLVYPREASEAKLKWSVKDTSVAEIDQNTQLVAKKEGKTKITLATEDGTVKTSVTIKVIKSLYETGNYTVGTELPSGEYKLFNNNEQKTATWELYEHPNQHKMIDKNIFGSFDYVKVKDGQFVILKNAYAIPMSIAPKYNGEDYYDSRFKVGFDIPEGEYKMKNQDPTHECYWAILSHPSKEDNIVKFGVLSGSSDIFVRSNIYEGQYVDLYNCDVEVTEKYLGDE